MARQGPRWQQKANIRANKRVPERRTQSHAVADAPLEGSPDEPECDGAGRLRIRRLGIRVPPSALSRPASVVGSRGLRPQL